MTPQLRARRRLLALFCISVVALAQISSPRIGFVRDRHGALRPLLGVPGAFLLGEPVLSGVVAAGSFGSEYALAATASELVVVRGLEVVWRRPLPGGAEAFGFKKDGRPDWVRFADGTCLVWPDKGEPELASLCKNDAQQHAHDPHTESVAPEWLLRRAPDRLYLRHTGTEEPIFELPEVPE